MQIKGFICARYMRDIEELRIQEDLTSVHNMPYGCIGGNMKAEYDEETGYLEVYGHLQYPIDQKDWNENWRIIK